MLCGQNSIYSQSLQAFPFIFISNPVLVSAPRAGVRFSIYKSSSYGRPFSIILAPQMKAAVSISLECWHFISTAKRLAHLKKKGEPDNGLDFSSISVEVLP